MLKRSTSKSRQPASKIIIVCEGKVTEPEYFRSFRQLHRNSLVEVKAIGGCGVPPSVVQRAIDEKNELVKAARKSKDSFDSYFEVWAAFDRDQHPKGQVPAALKMASDNGIYVAYSNPCFEVWGLMHFSAYSRPGHHHEVQAELKRQLTGYCHATNPVMRAEALKDQYINAVRNSEKMLVEREKEGRRYGDPSTSVHILTERIRNNKPY